MGGGLIESMIGREENKIIEDIQGKDQIVRGHNRIKTAKRLEKMGGIHYF